jgi:hypothetical protein
MREAIERVHPDIIKALRSGVLDAEGKILPSNLAALRALMKEEGGSELLEISMVATGIGEGPEEAMYTVHFKMSPKLLEE